MFVWVDFRDNGKQMRENRQEWWLVGREREEEKWWGLTIFFSGHQIYIYIYIFRNKHTHTYIGERERGFNTKAHHNSTQKSW